MSIRYLGALSLAGCVPMFALLHEQFSLCLGRTLAELKAKATGLANVSASIGLTPPTIDAQLELAAKLAAAIEAAIELQPPSLSGSLDALARIEAEIRATIELINATLNLAVELAGVAAAAGMHGFTYAGLAAELGVALSQAPGLTGVGAEKDIYCVAFMTEADRQAPVAAMKAVFAVG